MDTLRSPNPTHGRGTVPVAPDDLGDPASVRDRIVAS
jgi:hypothetical protein